jgi:hypothetical protein
MLMRDSRSGVVLPIVLLALLIVEILAAGTFALAHMQHSLARERVNALRAQVAARSGAAELASHWSGGFYQTVTPGTGSVVLSDALDAHARFTTTLERLTPTLFLLHGNGFAGPLPADEARATAGYLIAVHDIAAIAAQFSAALTSVGGVQLTGNAVVSSDQATLLPYGWSASECASWLPLPVAMPALVVGRERGECVITALLTGQPAVLEQSSLAQMPQDKLGQLDFAALHALADRVESGSLQLSALAVTGTCTTAAAANWGAPLDQAHPCANYFPLIFAPADLAIASGAGQGVLIVDGDLTLGPGAQFFGVVLVKGRIVANTGALISGTAWAGSGDPSLLLGASILRSNCAVSRALALAPGLNRAVPRRPRSWVPLY